MFRSEAEQYGKLALANILASIWLGDWDRYEQIFNNMEDELKGTFPFHSYYKREEVELWHENHFFIPGDYFVSPYFSSYSRKGEEGEERKKNLLCLIGLYEKMGFYFPVEQELFPDHMGCITSFLGAVLIEEINAGKERDLQLVEQLTILEKEIVSNYILPVIKQMKQSGERKIQHPFFHEFLPYHCEVMEEEFIAG